MLEFQSVNRSFQGPEGKVHALAEANLRVEPGEFVAVKGPSGCGKTTLLLTAGALLAPDSGKILLDGTDPYGLAIEARARLRGTTIGFVFQQFYLIPYLTVLENILAPSIAVRTEGASQRAHELMERFKLTSRAGHVPSELSTGERQRTALARALLNQPRLLLADEPTGNLDPENAAVVLGHIREFVSSGGAALMVTHDEGEKDYTDRVIHLRDGKIVQP